jgi:hypothetical protein
MKLLAIFFIVLLLTMNLPLIYSEGGYLYDSLRLRHADNPDICLFEVNPSLYSNWDELKNLTLIGIAEWIVKLEYAYPNGDWGVKVKIIPWEDHALKLAEDYNECDIMFNYEKTSNDMALGYTSLNFNKSWHKFMFINIFLESQKSITKIIIGGDNKTTISADSASYPLPPNTIKNIVVHELGHGFGLGHFYSGMDRQNGYTKSVMVESIDPFDKHQNLSVTYIDLKMLAKIYGENGWGSPQPVYQINGCNILSTFVFRCF